MVPVEPGVNSSIEDYVEPFGVDGLGLFQRRPECIGVLVAGDGFDRRQGNKVNAFLGGKAVDNSTWQFMDDANVSARRFRMAVIQHSVSETQIDQFFARLLDPLPHHFGNGGASIGSDWLAKRHWRTGLR